MVNEDEIFESYEDADLEAHGEEATDKGPLGTIHDDDFEQGHEWSPEPDAVEKQSRHTDYENMYGRTRTGKDGELDLSRVNLDNGGSTSGGAGGDWEGNFVPKGGAVQTTGFVYDTLGSTSQHSSHEDVDPELDREMRDAGLRLGINSVNTALAGFAMVSAQYARNKERWRRTSPEYKQYLNALRRMQRRNRDWDQVRDDSIARNYRDVFNGFIEDRTAEDPYWSYMDPGGDRAHERHRRQVGHADHHELEAQAGREGDAGSCSPLCRVLGGCAATEHQASMEAQTSPARVG